MIEQWQTNSKSYMIYRSAPFSLFIDLEQPIIKVSKVTQIFSVTVQDKDILTMEDE